MIVLKAKNILTGIITVAVLIGAITGIKIKAVKTSAQVQEGIRLPVIMYHSVSSSAKPDDKYVITPEEMERDLIYLKENNYTPIVFGDLENFVRNKSGLPEKPVILTFDDGFYNNYTNLFPLLKKYEMKAVISVVGYYCDNEQFTRDESSVYSYLKWDDIREMINSGYVEIQNHSYNFHNINKDIEGSKKNKNESNEAYKKRFCDDILRMQKRISDETGRSAVCFTYPFGMISSVSENYIAEMGFIASLSCEEGINYITENQKSFYLLKRYIRPQNKSLEQIMSGIK